MNERLRKNITKVFDTKFEGRVPKARFREKENPGSPIIIKESAEPRDFKNFQEFKTKMNFGNSNNFKKSIRERSYDKSLNMLESMSGYRSQNSGDQIEKARSKESKRSNETHSAFGHKNSKPILELNKYSDVAVSIRSIQKNKDKGNQSGISWTKPIITKKPILGEKSGSSQSKTKVASDSRQGVPSPSPKEYLNLRNLALQSSFADESNPQSVHSPSTTKREHYNYLTQSQQALPSDKPKDYDSAQASLKNNTRPDKSSGQKAKPSNIPLHYIKHTHSSSGSCMMDPLTKTAVQVSRNALTPSSSTSFESNAIKGLKNIKGSEKEVSFRLEELSQKIETRIERSFERLFKELHLQKKDAIKKMKAQIDKASKLLEEKQEINFEVEYQRVDYLQNMSEKASRDNLDLSKPSIAQRLSSLLRSEKVSINLQLNQVGKRSLDLTNSPQHRIMFNYQNSQSHSLNHLHSYHSQSSKKILQKEPNQLKPVETSFTQFFENNKLDFLDSFDPETFFEQQKQAERSRQAKTGSGQEGPSEKKAQAHKLSEKNNFFQMFSKYS